MNFDLIYNIYDLIYAKKDYENESKHVLEYLNKNNGSSLLEYGIGSANHAKFFKKEGYDIIGIEINEGMNQMAISKGFKSINDDMITYRSTKKFDNSVALFHVFSYITERVSQELFFENLRFNLKKGSRFVFDTWFTPAVYNIKPSKRITTFENEKMKIIRNSSPNINLINNTIDVNFNFNVHNFSLNKIYSFEENHKMRHFSIDEIMRLSESFGFKYLKSEEIITRNKPSLNTWSLLHIIEKK
jgi:hypothetical protein